MTGTMSKLFTRSPRLSSRFTHGSNTHQDDERKPVPPRASDAQGRDRGTSRIAQPIQRPSIPRVPMSAPKNSGYDEQRPTMHRRISSGSRRKFSCCKDPKLDVGEAPIHHRQGVHDVRVSALRPKGTYEARLPQSSSSQAKPASTRPLNLPKVDTSFSSLHDTPLPSSRSMPCRSGLESRLKRPQRMLLPVTEESTLPLRRQGRISQRPNEAKMGPNKTSREKETLSHFTAPMPSGGRNTTAHDAFAMHQDKVLRGQGNTAPAPGTCHTREQRTISQRKTLDNKARDVWGTVDRQSGALNETLFCRPEFRPQRSLVQHRPDDESITEYILQQMAMSRTTSASSQCKFLRSSQDNSNHQGSTNLLPQSSKGSRITSEAAHSRSPGRLSSTSSLQSIVIQPSLFQSSRTSTPTSEAPVPYRPCVELEDLPMRLQRVLNIMPVDDFLESPHLPHDNHYHHDVAATLLALREDSEPFFLKLGQPSIV